MGEGVVERLVVEFALESGLGLNATVVERGARLDALLAARVVDVVRGLGWREHGVKVTCSKTVLDEGDPFWTTGQPSDENYAEIVGLSAGLILTPIGHVEQLLSAGLACVYKNGAKAKGPTKERPHFHSVGYLPPHDLQVWFKFEGQRVCLQLMDWKDMGPSGLAIHMAAGSE